MPSKWRSKVIGRGAARRRSRRPARTRPTPRPIVFDRLLDARIVDQLLDQLLRRPRALQIISVVVALLLIALELYSLLRPVPAPSAPVRVPDPVVNTAAAASTATGVSVEQ